MVVLVHEKADLNCWSVGLQTLFFMKVKVATGPSTSLPSSPLTSHIRSTLPSALALDVNHEVQNIFICQQVLVKRKKKSETQVVLVKTVSDPSFASFFSLFVIIYNMQGQAAVLYNKTHIQLFFVSCLYHLGR